MTTTAPTDRCIYREAYYLGQGATCLDDAPAWVLEDEDCIVNFKDGMAEAEMWIAQAAYEASRGGHLTDGDDAAVGW